MDRLSELLGHHVQFSYTALDRIVLNGYIERLQRPANLVYLFHEVLGVACIEPAVLSQQTDRYRSWLRTYTAEGGPGAPRSQGRAERGPGPALLPTSWWSGRSRLCAHQHGTGTHLRLLYAPLSLDERGCQLPDHHKRPEAVSPLLLLCAGPRDGTDEPAGGQLSAIQCDLLPQRPFLHRSGIGPPGDPVP